MSPPDGFFTAEAIELTHQYSGTKNKNENYHNDLRCHAALYSAEWDSSFGR
jgi:hypothetical protein